MTGIHSIAWWPTVAVLFTATWTDLRSRRIPNWLSLPFLAMGVVVSSYLHGWRGLEQSLAGFAVGGVIFFVLAVMGGMGMGDVKLCAAVGAWIGPSQMFLAIVVTGIVGGIMALAWAAVGGFMKELLSGSGDLLFGWRKRGTLVHPDLVLENPRARKMPYAPAIALGTLFSFFTH